MTASKAKGPLAGYKIIEIAGVGPTQLTGMLLADMGAEIVRVVRLSQVELGVFMPEKYKLMNRSRRSIAIDLKKPQGRDIILELCAGADALFEGFRPGVMERLGLGPDECMQHNEKLVYGRMTGWGQDGPLADTAGHDPNYIGIAGVLACIGKKDEAPAYPLNLIGDFGGGALYLAMGLLAAMLEAAKSGKGQVVDAAMVDGAASMMTTFYGLLAAGLWKEQRSSNILDGGAHFVNTYQTKDKQYVVVAPIEGRFYSELLDRLEISDPDLRTQQHNQDRWPEFADKMQEIFLTKTRDEWCEIFEGADACFAPVLSLTEATQHPHAQARNAYADIDGVTQPAPAPRFSRTPAEIQSPPPEPGQHTEEVLLDWGFSEERINELVNARIIKSTSPGHSRTSGNPASEHSS